MRQLLLDRMGFDPPNLLVRMFTQVPGGPVMLDIDHSQTAQNTPQDQVLVLQTPQDADPDLIWEAFLMFVEDLLDVDVCDETHAEWSDVAPEEFASTVRARIDATRTDVRLHGIFCGERLAIVAPEGRLRLPDWAALREGLADTAAGDPSGWTVLIAPSDPDPAEGKAPAPAAPRPDGIRTERVMSSANRHMPLRATPEQQPYLALRAAQSDGRHPTLAMDPIVFDAPDTGAVRAAIEALQERHESLFTAFVSYDGQPFIVLDDSSALPLDRIRRLSPFSSLADRAAAKSVEMAETLHKTSAQWRACLIVARKQAALTCVFSQCIADQSSVDLFRSELIAFYEAFRDGRDPEAETPPPALQYTDFAARERDCGAALAWWDALLPPEHRPAPGPSLPAVAPANRFRKALPNRLWQDIQAVAGETGRLDALMLSAFLGGLHGVEDLDTAWFMLPVRDQRPPDAAGCIGQFTCLSPVWVGDLAETFAPDALAARLDAVRDEAALDHATMTGALAGRIPARIACFFDVTPRDTRQNELELPYDISLVVHPGQEGATACWAIRLDHPLCHRLERVHQTFCARLSDACRQLQS